MKRCLKIFISYYDEEYTLHHNYILCKEGQVCRLIIRITSV